MFRLTLVLLAVFCFVIVDKVTAVPTTQHEPVIPPRGCGTGPPSAELYKAHMQLHKASMAPQRLLGRATTNTTNTTTADNSTSTAISTRVFFHIVSTTDQQNLITDSMVYAQV